MSRPGGQLEAIGSKGTMGDFLAALASPLAHNGVANRIGT